MIQRYIMFNFDEVKVDNVEPGGNVFWCKSDDVFDIEAKYAKLVEAHEIALEALRYIAKLYDDSKPMYQVAYDAYAMKSEAATALERINEVMP